MGKVTTIRVREEIMKDFDELYEEMGGKEVFGKKDQFLYALIVYVKENVDRRDFLYHYVNKANPKLRELFTLVRENGKVEKKEAKGEVEDIEPRHEDVDILKEKML